MKSLSIGILGATGLVGRTLLNLLEEKTFSSFTVKELKLFASARSNGKTLSFREKIIAIEEPSLASLETCDVVFGCAGSSVSKKWFPDLIKKKIICIDKASHFRMHPEVPLLVPEINAKFAFNKDKELSSYLFASPNCCTIPLVSALQKIDDSFFLEHVFVSTYQSTSGAGQPGINTLQHQIIAQEETSPSLPSKGLGCFPKPIAYNVLPFIGAILENGQTEEEFKIVEETRKILGKPNLAIYPHSVRVPTLIGHAEAVTVKTKKSIDLKKLEKSYQTQSRIHLPQEGLTDTKNYFTPKDCEGTDSIYLSRFRLEDPKTLSFWIVCDNLRKGASLNALDILETLF